MSDTSTTQGGGALPENWVAYITPFAQTLSMSVEDATEKLRQISGEPGDQAIALLKDAGMTPDGDIKAVIPEGTPTGVSNKAISMLREAAAPAAGAMPFSAALDILPSVPNDESWLSALKAGGTLKVDEASVISAVRAGLARRFGLFDVPRLIVDAMEAFTDETHDQIDERFFRIRKQLTRTNYGEIFAAIDGLDGTYVTQGRKDKLFSRLDQYFWPSVSGFHTQLKGWVDAWQQGAANPGFMMTALAQMMAGGGTGSLPPGMMQPPETGGLRDAAEGVNDDINRVFAGTGVVVARALAFEANQIKSAVQDQALPALVGAANRDQMLRKLGVDISANYTRLETNLTKYVMGVLNIPNVPAGNEETTYFGSLYMLGTQIPWEETSTGMMGTSRDRRPNGGGTARRDQDRLDA